MTAIPLATALSFLTIGRTPDYSRLEPERVKIPPVDQHIRGELCFAPKRLDSVAGLIRTRFLHLADDVPYLGPGRSLQ